MRYLRLLCTAGLIVTAGCGGHKSLSGSAGENSPRPIIAAPCWKLNVHVTDNRRLAGTLDDTLGVESDPSKYVESKKQRNYIDKLRHRLADKYGLTFADNCFGHATLDLTLFVSNMTVSFIEEARPTARQTPKANDPSEGALGKLHRPPPQKQVTKSFDDVMKVEVRFADPMGKSIDPITLLDRTEAKAVADTIAAYLRLSR